MFISSTTATTHTTDPRTETILSQWNYEPRSQTEHVWLPYHLPVTPNSPSQRSSPRRGPKHLERPAESIHVARSRQAQRWHSLELLTPLRSDLTNSRRHRERKKRYISILEDGLAHVRQLYITESDSRRALEDECTRLRQLVSSYEFMGSSLFEAPPVSDELSALDMEPRFSVGSDISQVAMPPLVSIDRPARGRYSLDTLPTQISSNSGNTYFTYEEPFVSLATT